MLDRDRCYQLIDFVLSETGEHPARVMIMSQAGELTRYANSEIHQNVAEDVTSVTITVTGEGKRSRLSTTVCDEEGLRAAAADAVENLQYIPPGEEQPPPVTEPAEIVADHFDANLAADFQVEERARILRENLDVLGDDYLAYGKFSHKETRLAFGNSEGVRRFARNNQVDFSALVSGPGGTGYASTVSSRTDDLDVPGTFARASEKARMNQDRQAVQPGRYTVILEPLAVSNILALMSLIGFSARMVQNRASFLTGKMGEKVFDDRITVVDDHTDENTVSLPFDFEGYPRQKVTLVERGVVRGLVYDAASAQRDGVESTGHSADMPGRGGIPLHLVMAGGSGDLEQMIAGTEDGLLITRFHYMNMVNPREALMTGLTRDGVFRITGGRIVGVVKNMRFTDSMLRAFSNVTGVTAERERTPFFFGNYCVPAVRIEGFHFTGTTDA
ncbi:MAG: TldD/PmbA family protein [Bacillota bacterium]